MADENKILKEEVLREDFWEAWVKARLNDPREIAKMIAAKEYNSDYDSLTGILNRRGLEERMQQMEELMKRVNGKYAIAFLDLDGLKRVNDRDGHTAGDKLIKSAADALKHSRISDVVGRWGGDEFVAMFTLTDEESALIAIARIQEKLEEYDVKCSIGVVENKSNIMVRHVVEKAEDLMRQVKNEGLMEGERSGGVGVITIEI